MSRFCHVVPIASVLLFGTATWARDANDAGVGYTHAHGAKPAGAALSTQYPVVIGASDGTSSQWSRLFDADTGAGTQYVLGASLRASASGGSVEAGTAAAPLRTDPTGTTAQPISATSLPLPTGAATAAKQPALGTAGAASADVISVQGIASGTALPVSGTFYQATQPVSAAALPLPAGAATETTLVATNALLALIASANNAADGDAQKSDVADLSHTGTLWVGTGGSVKITLCEMTAGTFVTLLAVPDGSNPAACVKRLWTASTATNIVVMW